MKSIYHIRRFKPGSFILQLFIFDVIAITVLFLIYGYFSLDSYYLGEIVSPVLFILLIRLLNHNFAVRFYNKISSEKGGIELIVQPLLNRDGTIERNNYKVEALLFFPYLIRVAGVSLFSFLSVWGIFLIFITLAGGGGLFIIFSSAILIWLYPSVVLLHVVFVLAFNFCCKLFGGLPVTIAPFHDSESHLDLDYTIPLSGKTLHKDSKSKDEGEQSSS